MTLWVDMVVNCIGGGLPYIGLFSCIELENVLNEHWSIIVYAFASTWKIVVVNMQYISREVLKNSVVLKYKAQTLH